MADLREREQAGEIGPFSLIEDQPTYFFMGELDGLVPNQHTETARDIYNELGANVSFNPNPKFGHWAPENESGRI